VSAESAAQATLTPTYDYQERMRRLKQLERKDVSPVSMPDVTLLSGKFGHCIFASPAEVVACMKTGKAHSELAFAYEATLPKTLPPSYKGSSAKYFYMITIGIKLASSNIANVVHVPFSVISSSTIPSVSETGGVTLLRRKSSLVLLDQDFGVKSWFLGEAYELAADGLRRRNSNNVFSDLQQIDDFPVNPRRRAFKIHDFDCTGGYERDVTSGSLHKEQVFSIGTSGVHMAHLHMYKRQVCPGEQILLLFDFKDSPCLQVSVALQVEEVSKTPLSLNIALDPLTKGNAQSQGTGVWSKVLVSKHVQVAFNSTRSLVLTVPTDATPDFETPLISVKSYLKFEFVTSENDLPISSSSELVQTCPWKTPLEIIVPKPPAKNTNDSGILLLSSSTQSNLIHKRCWIG